MNTKLMQGNAREGGDEAGLEGTKQFREKKFHNCVEEYKREKR